MGLLNDFSPAGAAVDLSTTDALYTAPVGIRVDVAGTFKIDTIETVGLTGNGSAGEVLPWAVKKVYKTGTGATLHSIKLP